MKKRSSLLATVLALLIVLGIAPSASANHYVWLINDSSKQISTWSGYENWTNYWVVQDISI